MSTKQRLGGFVKRASVSPYAFLEIIRKQRDNVEATKIVAPKLGSRGFGKIEV